MRILKGSDNTVRLALSDLDRALTLVSPPVCSVVPLLSSAYTPSAVASGIPNLWDIRITSANCSVIDQAVLTVTGGTATARVPLVTVSSRAFDLSKLRGMPDLDNDRFSYNDLADAREWAETQTNRFIGVPMVYQTHIVNVSHYDPVYLSSGVPFVWLGVEKVLSVESLVVNGVAQNVEGLEVDWLGRLTGVQFLSGDRIRAVLVVGVDEWWPEDLSQALLVAARAKVLSMGASGIPDRARGMSNEFGSISFSTANRNAPTGFDAVDSVLVGWRDRLATPGVG